MGDGRRVEIAALYTVDERAAAETGVCMGGGGVLLAMEDSAKMAALHRLEAAAGTGASMGDGRRCKDGSAS